MTDLEITRLCAEAMGIQTVVHPIRGKIMRHWFWIHNIEQTYDPLHDDAQAMALVKKFRLQVDWSAGDLVWVNNRRESYAKADLADFNRAICECVAKMQKAKL